MGNTVDFDAADRSAVRREGRARRKALVGDARSKATRSLSGHVWSLDLVRQASVIGTFIAHDGEPDVEPIAALVRSVGNTVALPKLVDDSADFSMTFVAWSAKDTLVAGRFDIPVPDGGTEAVPDVVLVPFTGFDTWGNRIGRGGGFFDRYLADTEATIVGVGFEAQRFDRIPVESHDVPLPVIVTDLGVRYF